MMPLETVKLDDYIVGKAVIIFSKKFPKPFVVILLKHKLSEKIKLVLIYYNQSENAGIEDNKEITGKWTSLSFEQVKPITFKEIYSNEIENLSDADSSIFAFSITGIDKVGKRVMNIQEFELDMKTKKFIRSPKGTNLETSESIFYLDVFNVGRENVMEVLFVNKKEEVRFILREFFRNPINLKIESRVLNSQNFEDDSQNSIF